MKKSRVTINHSFVKLPAGADMAPRQLPFMVAKSATPGPMVWLTACSHGDEICGLAVIQELFKQLPKQLVCGTVNAFPLMNPLGAEMVMRLLPFGNEDLNRSFPGSAEGTAGERLAWHIFSHITQTKPDLVLDLHTDDTLSIPYVLIDHDDGHLAKTVYAQIAALAAKTGLAVVLDKKPIRKSLSYNLLKQKIPALTLELGEPHIINEANVACGVKAICNLLAHQDMMPPQKEDFCFPLPTPYNTGKPLQYADTPYSSTSGVARFLAEPGSVIKKGQAFARIVNAFGDLQETLNAAHTGLVLGQARSAIVYPGRSVMTFGILQK